MSSNLDRSLDEILATRPRTGRRGGNKAAVAGGIRKRPQRAAAQKANASIAPNTARAAALAKAPTGPSGKVSASKIIVSNLPYDVNEQMIKEYFQSVVGPIRRAILTYGPDGRSRGVATVEFTKPEHAATAAQKYNGVEVDKRPMKVELVVDPNAPANFADRVGAPNKISPPKTQKPKAVAKSAAKPAAVRGRAGTRGGKRGGRAGSGRGKPKTAEELDQEMADYFGGDVNPSGNAVPVATSTAATNGGDVGMEDTVL